MDLLKQFYMQNLESRIATYQCVAEEALWKMIVSCEAFFVVCRSLLHITIFTKERR